jgi:hypothetical protein
MPQTLDPTSCGLAKENERHLLEWQADYRPTPNSHPTTLNGFRTRHAQRHQWHNFRSDQVRPSLRWRTTAITLILSFVYSPKDIANLKNEIEKRQKETPDNASQQQTETVVVDKASEGATATQGEQLASS